MTSQRETYKPNFEDELLTLLKENNRLLRSIDEKLRKVVMNTSSVR